MSDAEFLDRRIFERLPVSMPMRFLEEDSSRECVAETQDISAKGIGFTTTAQLIPHSSLEMWLHMPDKKAPLYTRGNVVWSVPQSKDTYRVGVNLEKADLMGMSRAIRRT
jgi:hypothetical protein